MNIPRCPVCESALYPLAPQYCEHEPLVYLCHFGCMQWSVDEDECRRTMKRQEVQKIDEETEGSRASPVQPESSEM
jgi:hypothetical protein